MARWIGWCFLMLVSNVVYGITALPAYTVFYLPATNGGTATPYIEVYWQIDPYSVDFAMDDKEIWRGKIKTELELVHDTGVVASEKYYLQTTPASSLLAAQLQNIMDLHRYTVAPGKIRIRLRLSQEGQQKPAFEYIDSFEVQAPGKFFYSGLQLLDTSYKTDLKENIYLKNGNLQVPQCINFLDDRRKLLHYYTELYGTDNISKDEWPLVQWISVSKKEYDYPVVKLNNIDTIKPAAVLPVLGSFKIEALPSGNYYLNAVLKNSKGAEIARKSLFFQRSNTNPVVAAVVKDTTKGADSTEPLFEKVNLFDLSETFVGKYNVAQLKAIMKMLRPVATEAELLNIEGFITRPDETYMRYFVYNYWKTRIPEDPEKAWDDYTKLVRDVNKMFGSKSKPGYETERGFFYLKYGPPDQRLIVTSEEGALPYEVWQYNAPGNQSNPGAFLFYNPGFMVHEYRLLHSTVRGEMRNTSWRQELYKGRSTTGNNNSRAEEIFQYK